MLKNELEKQMKYNQEKNKAAKEYDYAYANTVQNNLKNWQNAEKIKMVIK